VYVFRLVYKLILKNMIYIAFWNSSLALEYIRQLNVSAELYRDDWDELAEKV